MAAETTSRMPAAITPSTPKACLAIDAPFVAAASRHGLPVHRCKGRPPASAVGLDLSAERSFPDAAHATVAAQASSEALAACGERASRSSSPWQKLRGDRGFVHWLHLPGRRLMHKSLDPNTCDAATNTQPLKLVRLPDSLLFVNRFSCVCALVDLCGPHRDEA